jgi:hypothetical protein
MGGDTRPLGQLWMSHFIKRNPRVKSVIGRKLQACCAEAATPEQISAFLETVGRVRTSIGIRVEDIRNMDETGIALGVGVNSRVLASSHKKKAYIKSPENREWVSIIESVSATGQKLPSPSYLRAKAYKQPGFRHQYPAGSIQPQRLGGHLKKSV